MRFFLLLALVFVAVWLFRGSRRRDLPGAPPPSGTPKADAHTTGESIVACVHCGLHLPRSEAISGEAGWFCGDAHRLAHDNARPR